MYGVHLRYIIYVQIHDTRHDTYYIIGKYACDVHYIGYSTHYNIHILYMYIPLRVRIEQYETAYESLYDCPF